MRITFCYNVKHESKEGLASELDYDAPQTIAAITRTIQELGHEVTEVEATEHIFEKLAALKGETDLVFNIAEGLHGDARESWVPLVCEILRIPYTHSNTTVHALKLNKTLAKLAVKGLGVRVPKSVRIEDKKQIYEGRLKFPVIIKPNAEGSSVGVFDANVVETKAQLRKRVAQMRSQGFTGELIAEEYLAGREFTVGVVGNGSGAEVLPIIEQRFDILPPGMKPIAGYELKWLVEDTLEDITKAYDCPAKINRKLRAEIKKTSKLIYAGLEVRDCARIDYRLDSRGKLYFLEINTLPGLNPDPTVISYMPIAARTAEMDFRDLVSRIIREASRRYGLRVKRHSTIKRVTTGRETRMISRS